MDPIVGVVLAALVSAFASYLAAARRLSGKINTSDAAELWSESRSIREWSAERIAHLTAQVTELENRVEIVEGHNLTLISDKTKLLQQLQELMGELEASKNTVGVLSTQLNLANEHVLELEEDIRALEGKRRHEKNGE